ncbi:MAG: aromatic ring-hydroxylating dioxygenase subunit alpha [Ilumatobacteraceae bacterium]
MVYVPTRGDAPVRLGPTVDRVPAKGGTKMSRDCYTDPVQYELEREKVLARSWIIAGRSSEITETGDWLSFEGHGETVVVTRQPDGSLAAFQNVCMHRGPSFVTELSGKCARRFTCMYHNWVYDTTGKLVGLPEREDFDPDHLEGVRAPKVAADEWGGFVWINLAGDDAPSLMSWIGEEIAVDLGRFRMEDMILHEVVEWDVPVSYKAVVDGFNEIYHAPALHNTGADWARSARDSSFFTVNDKNFMCFVPRARYREQLEQGWDHHQYAICHYVVFPNTVFNCNPEHIQVFNPIPVGVDRTHFKCWELVYPGDMADPEYAEYWERTMMHWSHLKVVVGEDISIYDQLARTKQASGYREHILNEREFKIAEYHAAMSRLIAE